MLSTYIRQYRYELHEKITFYNYELYKSINNKKGIFWWKRGGSKGVW